MTDKPPAKPASKAKAAAKRKRTMNSQQRTIDELRREIEAQRLRLQTAAERVNYLRAELDDLDGDYQSKCWQMRARGQAHAATLEDIRKALQRNPPNIAGALELIAKELD
jgi:uncharacterized coiled-coil protein SlyX